LTLAVEHAGSNWGRSADAVGLAAGLLKTGSRYQVASQDGSLQGYASGGNERLMEIYYRYQVNEKLSLSPDFQLITRPGGDGNASRVRVAGLRANLGF
jgi:carbohydrate-selective porin OprB